MTKQEIGKILLDAREESGITSNKSGIMVDVYGHQVRSIEEGNKNYRIDTLIAYAENLGYELILQKKE